MRLHYVLLLASAALLSTIDASLAITSSKTSTLSSPAAARSLFVEQHNIVSKRLLRAETTADEDEEEEEEGEEEGENEEEDEERGITLPSSATKKIAKLAMSSDEIARIQAKLDRVFKGIQLDKKNSYLFGDANLRKWAQNALNMHGNSETASAAMLST
uniref:RxLR effector protein n=1 Tax=Phytophthora ramorum TaxID=164328 RepID=H3H695_PHYRM